MKILSSFALTGLLALSLQSSKVQAEEGMWPYNMVPTETWQKDYGFAPDAEWLKEARLSSLRFNVGGSGSFVSKHGLVMTNHHVGADCIQKLSQGKNDYMAHGFYAKNNSEELKCPDLELNQLINMTDMTDRMKKAALSGKNDEEKNKLRKIEKAAIEKECSESTKNRCDLMSLYDGGLYHLYEYKKYTDIRLTFAPEFQAAFFGGDIENFEYQRTALDMTFFRVYENNSPVETTHYFPFAKTGVKENELIFVSGHPGSTGRFSSVAEMHFLRDDAYPYYLDRLKKKEKLLKAYMDLGPEQYKSARDGYFGVQNGLKAVAGFLRGLKDPARMAKAEKREADMLTALKSKQTPAEFKATQNAFKKVKEGYAAFKPWYKEKSLIAGMGRSTLLAHALFLYRHPTEMKKTDGDRLRAYQDSRLESSKMRHLSKAPIDIELEKLKIAQYLKDFMALKKDNFNTFIGQIITPANIEGLAATMVEGSKIASLEERQKLFNADEKTFKASQDPLIILVSKIDPLLREYKERAEKGAESAINNSDYAGLIGRSWGLAFGKGLYPDATFSLRLNIGQVKSYTQDDGEFQPWSTQFGDMYSKSKQMKNKKPYDLPEHWAKNINRVNFSMPMNFVSTNDIIGGNSGSPMLNQNREVIGLVFDGNYESLPNRFVYNEEQERAISVDSRAILHSLYRIYGAAKLARELQDKD